MDLLLPKCPTSFYNQPKYLFATRDGKSCIFDMKGNRVEELPKSEPTATRDSPEYIFINAFVSDNGKVGYKNFKRNTTIPAVFDSMRRTYWHNKTYTSVGDYFRSDGFAVVRVGSHFGVIDMTGAYVIEPRFDGIDGYYIDED